MTPHVGHGQSDELGKTSGPVHSDSRRVCAKVPQAGHAVAAAAADDVSLSGNPFAWMKIVDVGPDFDNLSHEFMANDHGNRDRVFRPIVPVEDVNVRPADSRA